MQDPLAKAYRYRKVAVEFSNLSKRTSSDFSRAYYKAVPRMKPVPALSASRTITVIMQPPGLRSTHLHSVTSTTFWVQNLRVT